MNLTESNVWFYTLSTIAQTCAAILALGGTFVIFKLDKLQSALSNYRGRIISIITVWRGIDKLPDKFFDETNEDILSDYYKIVKDNKDNQKNVFDRKGLNEKYTLYERPYIISINKKSDELWIFDDGLKLDHQERERWCNRMADLFGKNIKIEKNIFLHLKQAITLLSSSILLSIFVLSNFNSILINNSSLLLLFIVVLSSTAIIYSAIAVWDIAKAKPIL